MRFSTNLYYKDIKRRSLVKFRLITGVLQFGMFVVSINCHGEQLDIYPIELLKQRYFRESPLFIVAITGSHEAALEYVAHIADCCYKDRGDYLIREFLLDREPSSRKYLYGKA